MERFDFAELYSFLQTILCMILSYLAGRRTTTRNEKSRPLDKVNGSDANTD